MNMRKELEKVESKLRTKQDELEYQVVKTFVSWVFDSIDDDKFDCLIFDLKQEYIQSHATLVAICQILDYMKREDGELAEQGIEVEE